VIVTVIEIVIGTVQGWRNQDEDGDRRKGVQEEEEEELVSMQF